MQTTESLRIQAYNISWAGNTTDIVYGDTFSTPDDPGIAGTHFAVTALPNSDGSSDVNIFVQTDGNDVTEYIRDSNGSWSKVDITIPDE